MKQLDRIHPLHGVIMVCTHVNSTVEHFKWIYRRTKIMLSYVITFLWVCPIGIALYFKRGHLAME